MPNLNRIQNHRQKNTQPLGEELGIKSGHLSLLYKDVSILLFLIIDKYFFKSCGFLLPNVAVCRQQCRVFLH